MRKRSLALQYTGTIFGLVIGVILLCWLTNAFFLRSYYAYYKRNSMKKAFASIDQASRNGTLESRGFDAVFQNLCADSDIDILVIRPDWSIVRSSVEDETMSKQQLRDIWLDFRRHPAVLLEDTERYSLIKWVDFRNNRRTYLVFYGWLGNGNAVQIRTAMENIIVSTRIFNRFFVYSGFLAAVFGAIISIFASKRLTRPIRMLTEISKKMTNLDFNAKYVPGGTNEIDQLGRHMNQLSQTLEKTISELKSANNKLKDDIEKKIRIDEMRKEFLSNVSHELKTPLALIQGYAEGLQECVHEDEENRDFYCEVIVDEAGKMNRMVKKLLTLNQLEFGTDPVSMERFDLTELIRGLIQSSSILLEQSGITLTFHTDAPLYVWADEFKVEEVITNYLSNAIHHAKDPKHIDIKYTQAGTDVRVSIFNTGDPIPPEDLEQIWVKFYKVDKARTREYGGSGIGLSIVKAIMDSFHKKCGVINHADGVEFWFELEECKNVN